MEKPLSLFRLIEESARLAPRSNAILSVDPARAPLTYEALLAHVTHTMAELNRLGLGRGDRVAMVLPAGPEMATAFLAIAGATTSAPLNPGYRAQEYDFYLTDLAAKAIVVEAGVESPAIGVARERGIRVIELHPSLDQAAGVFTLRDVSGSPAAPAARSGPAEAEDMAIVLHTSGTTSRPKIVPLTQANLCHATWAIVEALSLTAADRCLNVMPLFHIHGLSAVFGSLAVQGSCVCPPGFLAPRFYDWLDAFAPSWYTAAPTIHQAVLDRAPQHADVIARRRFRFLRSASSAMLPQVIAEMERVFDCPFIEAYGMTEAAPQIAANPLPPAVRKKGSVGLPAGTRVAILDDAGNELAARERGEVSIQGPNVMRAYENNPGADKIAFTNGWFRTGDQGFLDEDGYLFITGRLKEIINRGGEKISPREVDEVLIDHPAVARVVTFAVADPKLGEDVAAVVVLKPGTHATERELREHAFKRLADFKVPRQIVFRDEIPQGATAKAVRIGLAEKLGVTAIVAPEPGKHDYVAPRTELETKIAGLWREVLGLERVGATDNFFEVGGDSVLAAQLLARVREETRVEISLLALFEEASTVAGMATCVETTAPSEALAPIARLQDGAEMPLSFAQEGLWFADQVDPGHPVYNVYRAMRLTGPLDLDALEKGLDEIVRRQEALRTTYPAKDGRPLRVVNPPFHVGLPILDLSDVPADKRDAEIERLTVKEALRPMSVANDPMLRATLLRLAPEDHVVVLVTHHIAADAWSLQVLLGELAVLYTDFASGRAPSLPPLPIQDKDFAGWQRKVQSEAFGKQVAYWREQLAGAPGVLDLPTDHARPSTKSYKGARRNVAINEATVQRIRGVSQKEGVTPFMTLAAAYAVLLQHASQKEELLIGTHTAGRSRVETEGLIGAFINTLVLRFDLTQNPTFRELLGRVRKMALGAYAHQDLPFNKLLEDLRVPRTLGRSPLFQVKFRLQNVPAASLDFKGLDAKMLEVDYGMIKVDLGLELLEKPGAGLVGFFEYATDLFDKSTIDRFWSELERILEMVIENPNARLSSIRQALVTPPGKQGMEEKKEDAGTEGKAKTSLKGARRKAAPTQSLVKTSQLVASESPIFLLVEPTSDNVDLVEWASANKEQVNNLLLEHGALLFRGFPVKEIAQFEAFCKATTNTLLEYKNGSTPRSQVSGNVYTSTEFPADRSIPMHNEMSYSTAWPLKLWLHCVIASETGGETPLCDSVKFYSRLSQATRDKFAEKGVLYVRNYGEGFDVPWQKVFETDDKAKVEAFCKESGIELEWLSGDRLRTKQKCQGVSKHWKTGETIFMNQAHLFNMHALRPDERKSMLEAFKKEDLPRNSYYGDGTDIEDATLDEIQRVYDETSIAFPWLAGDVVMVDNMRVAHGRRPFTGKRRIVVALAEAYTPA
jgi:acyl-CoA synthetase (AMP-forming)/AMP-acid ligase II/alpha-ketoglutarate-dependent taurine dioxygenase/acyl carrier protein